MQVPERDGNQPSCEPVPLSNSDKSYRHLHAQRAAEPGATMIRRSAGPADVRGPARNCDENPERWDGMS